MQSQAAQSVSVLGSTGSIGVSTLDVLARHPQRYAVHALTARGRIAELAQQCRRFKPRFAVVATEKGAAELRQLLADESSSVEILWGSEGLCQVASDPQVDVVMAAIVGAAGLRPTLAAVEAGKKVLLANKEALVMAGPVFMRALARSGARLLPIDSEHNAIFQCLPQPCASLEEAGVEKILLTGSGGPFRTRAVSDLHRVTPDEACAHPNWSMGRKISVDSATMMNKGLEFIEACLLFNARPEQIEVVVHPQSIVHSMVQYRDGSLLAQMGNPDMRTPIAHALAFPERIDSGVAALDLIAQGRLDFEAPDIQRFPCLRLAREAMDAGGSAPAVLNAANEVAVEAFLEGKLAFTSIPAVIEQVMKSAQVVELTGLDAVETADCNARLQARQVLEAL
ncbi:1-deoxy-D-xylulose-5-phosphate reductoisomerase [Microbulbifer thermotolerans]|uniref:1-deoxy-D-xylulose 5-phosphate reductoisomerase n=1 Tax=Microbulbifer thermotolerans TaxID=252514 RepID=A0A143HKK8_MICTH|nr:1-deoxy-D-xylulose-5-phosphate reductoisomerase [Microbulbifer thermotolerans]AMX02223.1 1-deoxy-D-xylulose-5-phosphate reductoisomerase [Microbulbifer thermotolerans]MCX2778802.1 1-deoxy-D-xylulose-5-phosphate reductoisomerase [Microbulbifer thermotolerans]MCX2804107.1 1-deoxy-D-xylulose-5-phosphate reductoisomerase [Microbulbifer thermotolerans]WKT61798.1 1-deoxy-D-xylulose-5-phosphate reductoisomerase [Microbulbifer thermotolerans]SFB74863.1 1-deoxy-D-xylulose 5-phosphate reductoisomeras